MHYRKLEKGKKFKKKNKKLEKNVNFVAVRYECS